MNDAQTIELLRAGIKELQSTVIGLQKLIEKRAIENIITNEALISVASALVLKGGLSTLDIKSEFPTGAPISMKNSTGETREFNKVFEKTYLQHRSDFFEALDLLE